ncbi:deoxyribodipyrimidine photo-lyase [candidate division KSB1 bacterium]|nr:deoxyribodipyrimidine photo-lyase [candidate division KSB1 bacterium]
MLESPTAVSLFWFRRDLRLDDNSGLYHALKSGLPVVPIFIFDRHILDELEDPQDKRVEFIHSSLHDLQKELIARGATLDVRHSTPEQAWQDLIREYTFSAVYANRDQEPYAIERDRRITRLLAAEKIVFKQYKDQTIFQADEILKDDGKPYTVYTPYRNRWKRAFTLKDAAEVASRTTGRFFRQEPRPIPPLSELGFKTTGASFPSREINTLVVKNYDRHRDIPGIQGTSRLGVHLRFGTISTRFAVRTALELNETWLDELIWREFFKSILSHFPEVAEHPFKPQYAAIPWINDETHFELWCRGETGFPIVDAGMRELNTTGFMHNRIRMITAGFLSKHLLIDWLWGERYFAAKLLDYDLSSNNGNWQWAAGSGCDAAPYFRIFNPLLQEKKFDPQQTYIKKWVPEIGTTDYPQPIVDHAFARIRAIETFRTALESIRR